MIPSCSRIAFGITTCPFGPTREVIPISITSIGATRLANYLHFCSAPPGTRTQNLRIKSRRQLAPVSRYRHRSRSGSLGREAPTRPVK
jgi:hypothetical protein